MIKTGGNNSDNALPPFTGETNIKLAAAADTSRGNEFQKAIMNGNIPAGGGGLPTSSTHVESVTFAGDAQATKTGASLHETYLSNVAESANDGFSVGGKKKNKSKKNKSKKNKSKKNKSKKNKSKKNKSKKNKSKKNKSKKNKSKKNKSKPKKRV